MCRTLQPPPSPPAPHSFFFLSLAHHLPMEEVGDVTITTVHLIHSNHLAVGYTIGSCRQSFGPVLTGSQPDATPIYAVWHALLSAHARIRC